MNDIFYIHYYIVATFAAEKRNKSINENQNTNGKTEKISAEHDAHLCEYFNVRANGNYGNCGR